MNFQFNKKAKRDQQMQGFTIIETLVAITVLMIAIAGPLSVAGKGLNAATYARDQMTATYLAQETMEVVKNYRDNWLQGPNAGWPVLFNGFDCTATACDGDALEGFVTGCGSVPNSLTGCPLYLSSDGSGYVRDPAAGTTQQFRRYFYAKPYTDANGNEEETIHIGVTWTEGNVPYEIDLSSQLADVIRN